MSSPEEILVDVRAGSRSALARALTIVETSSPGAQELRSRLYGDSASTGYTVGLTGAPGVGKSTIVGGLVEVLRDRGERVAVLAVDPTSPRTGGAVLGDRVRLGERAGDRDVYVRSMASRNDVDGVAPGAAAALALFRFAGYRWTLFESVGVGQVHFGVERLSDTSVVVLTPGAGDWVQAHKAGLMEVADIFVINKADLAGADRVRRDVEGMLDLVERDDWRPPVLLTWSHERDGLAEVVSAIDSHRAHIEGSGALDGQRRRRWVEELRSAAHHLAAMETDRLLVDVVESSVLRLDEDPVVVAERVLGLVPRSAGQGPSDER